MKQDLMNVLLTNILLFFKIQIFFFFFQMLFQTQMPDPKTFKQHFESKHPKSPKPPELVNVEA